MSMKDIGILYEITEQTVFRNMKKFGISRKSHKDKNHKSLTLKEAIQKLEEAGLCERFEILLYPENSGQVKTKLLNKKYNREFEWIFSKFLAAIKAEPTREFCLTTKETYERAKAGMIKKYGKPYPLQIDEFRKKTVGANHFNWKGGQNLSLNFKLRKSAKYKQWKKACLEKNKNNCIICGSQERIEIDHIKPFSVLLEEFNIKTFEEGILCENLWNPENGRALCRVHHKKTSTYGQGSKNLLKR